MKNAKIIAVFAAFLALLTYCLDLRSELRKSAGSVAALSSEVKIWRDREGRSRARADVLEIRSFQFLEELETKDADIRRLKELQKSHKRLIKKQGALITALQRTDVDVDVPASVDSSGGVSGAVDLSGWITGRLGFRSDSLFANLQVRNRYSVVLGYQRVGLFKRKMVAEVINDNPFTHQESLRAVHVSPPRRAGLRPFLWGVASGSVAVMLLDRAGR